MHHRANSHVSALIPPLRDPPTAEDVAGVLRQVVAFCHLFVTGGAHEPVFSADGTEVRLKADRFAAETLKMAISMAKDSKAILGLVL